MGLFDGIRAKTSPTFTPQQAMMTIVLAAIMSDGSVSDEEINRLRSMCARSPIFSTNSKDEDDRVIDYAINVIEQLDMNGVRLAAQALRPALRETAFAFAVEMVMADGMIGGSEEALITELAEILDIKEQTATAIIDVTGIRARGPSS